MHYETPTIRILSTADPKIGALGKCIDRICDVDSYALLERASDADGSRKRRWKRFAGLFLAQKRRTRVLMRRVIKLVGGNAL